MANIGINGFGRIGRLAFRAYVEKYGTKNIGLINSPGEPETLAHLYNYDSTHGPAALKAEIVNGNFSISGNSVPISRERDPASIPWGDMGVDLVLECSGKFNEGEKCAAHLKAGARKVIISAPAPGAHAYIVMGVNHESLKGSDDIISLGSCTTNALAPLAKVIEDNFIIEAGYATTVHAYTCDQNILDSSHPDLRRARSAFLSAIPTKTGAASALSLILPSLKGKIDGSAIRVPLSNVSMIDFSFSSKKKVSAEDIDRAMEGASLGYLSGILGISPAPLVSVDFNHSPYSSIYDPFETRVVGDNFARIVSWYDNEWAFALRLLDCAERVSKFFLN